MGREIEFFEDHFVEFYSTLGPKHQRKVEFVLAFIRDEYQLSSKFLKKIHGVDKLFEIRIHYDGVAIRLFCIPLEKNGWLILHGFIKKTNKTPQKEISKAQALIKKYEKSNQPN